MKTHLTLINNNNHSHKSTVLIDEGSDVLKIAKNKLRLSKACKLYGLGGNVYEKSSSIAYVSCGEPYVGPEYKLGAFVKIIGKKSEIDSGAREELNHVAGLPGVVAVYGMPDLHAGPTGCAVISEGCIYPHLAGSDIGCGIAIFKVNSGFSINAMKKQINTILPLSKEKICSILEKNCVAPTCPEDAQLGTIGSGNHFAEFMEVVEVYDLEKTKRLGISYGDIILCVHSGSRHLGKKIFDNFGGHSIQDNNSRNQILSRDDQLSKYMDRHDHAVKWSKINRYMIASRILDSDPELILDITHNSISRAYQTTPRVSKQWIHRKGAAPSDMGPILIPGSRGTWSYLVDPSESAKISECGSSLAHGAGRRLTRSKAYQQSVKKYGNRLDGINDIRMSNNSMSYVIGNDTRVLAEETPEAYKNINEIIDDLSPYITKMSRLKPVLTIKNLD